MLEAAFNECVAIAVQLASKKEDADEAAHVGSEPATVEQPKKSEASSESPTVEPGTLAADASGDQAETQSTMGGGSGGSHGGSGVGPHARPAAPWSRYSLETLENDAFSGAGLTFKILRAAVLTQPLLIEYFDTPFQLNFL